MRGTYAAALLSVITLTPVAQTPAPPAQQLPAAPVFRSGVDLVRLDVRVIDADGHPIKDIRASDIEVIEDGQVRPVLLFQHVEQPEGAYADVAQRTVASEVSTNQGAPRGSLYVLVFDQGHIPIGGEQRARLAAERFLRTQFRPGDRVALYAMSGAGPRIDFTSDASRAIEALKSVRGYRDDVVTGGTGPMRVGEAYEIVRGNEATVIQYMLRLQGINSAIDSVPVVERGGRTVPETTGVLRSQIQGDARGIVERADGEARRFLSELAGTIRSLRDVDGRKAVILFSEGFEVDNVRRELTDVAAAAAQSRCVVYGMDLNLRTNSLAEATPADVAPGTEILSKLEMLGGLTAETDGQLYPDASSRSDAVLSEIADASQDYYLVGFAPAEAALSNRDEYRPVKVVVKRPGARVQARTGYSVGKAVLESDRRRAIDTALHAPFSQQGLHVEYTTYVLRGTAGQQRVIMSLSAELPVASGRDKTADVVFAVRDTRDGRVAASGTDTMPLPDISRGGATTGSGHFRVQFTLPAGVYIMRAVVREPGGLTGSADRRFTVRPLGGPGVTVADLVLSSADTRGLGVRAVAYQNDSVTGVTEIYARSAAQMNQVSVSAALVPVGWAAAVVAGRADLDEIKTTQAGSSRGARIQIPLAGIKPGEYIVRVMVKNGRETVAELLRDVTVLNEKSLD